MKIKFLLMLIVLCFVFTEIKAQETSDGTPLTSKSDNSPQEVFNKLKETHDKNIIFND